MKKIKIISALLLAGFALGSASAKVTEAKWWVVETPDAWNAGESLVIKVTTKTDIPAGMQICSHLQWFKKAGWGGFLSWSEGKSAEPGETYSFTHKPKYNAEMDRINALCFLAPGGTFEKKVADSNTEIMAQPPAPPKKTADGNLLKDLDWAILEVPEKWEPGSPLVVKVTPKSGIPSGMKVACDLHWMKRDGWGGVMNCWTPAQDAVPGKTLIFTKKPNNPDGIDRIDALVFLAPNGDFNKKIKDSHNTVGLTKPPAPQYPPMPEGISFKKSSLFVSGTSTQNAKPATKGDKVSITVKYHLDPSETWGDKPTQISAMPLGPWIDNPDGTINKGRSHVFYHGLWELKKPVTPGDGEITFEWTVEQTSRYNGHFFLLKFIRPDGKAWPWDWRGGGISIVRENKNFVLLSDSVGGLFTYGSDPVIKLIWGSKPTDGVRDASVTVRDVDGKTVLLKKVKVDPAHKTETIVIDGLAKRGVFSATVEVPEVGEDYTFFGTVPKFIRRPGKDTPFGVTDISTPELSELAASLGFTFVRHFTGWAGIERSPDVFSFEGLDRVIASNTGAGLRPWLSLQGSPCWNLPAGMYGFGFEPAPFDLKAWGKLVDAIARRYKGKLYGFEWLNEIVPGNKCDDPVATYLDICKVGTTAAKKVDPEYVIQLAGGLWPHNFRVDLLNAGIGRYIDVLPVHYGNYSSVIEAKRDTLSHGLTKVRVADNESAAGISTWNMNAEQTLSSSIRQCLHVMNNWPDELAAGAEFIIYFGGAPNAAGNWTYLLDNNTPRPVAATLAVVQNKLAYAKPIGKFFIDGKTSVQLFEEGEKAIAFVKAQGESSHSVTLPTKDVLTITDYQGNETVQKEKTLPVADMPVIVEGADLDALKLHAALTVGTSPVPVPVPQAVAGAGDAIKVPARVYNPWSDKRSFVLSPESTDWAKAAPISVSLLPGETKTVEIIYETVPDAKIVPSTLLSVKMQTKGIADVVKPFMLYVTDEASIGNLLKNGDFEGADGKPGAAPWGGNGVLVSVPVPGDPDNHAFALQGKGRGKYQHTSQGVTFPVPGQVYLYTVWMCGENMGGGSNIGEHFANGKNRDYFMPQVFNVGGSGSTSWRLMTKQFATQADTVGAHFTPVADGDKGRVLYDNISVTLYKGTDFAALAGSKGSSARSSRIPLLCDNQIRSEGGYKWTPENLGGIALFEWDETGLSFDVSVEDNILSTVPAPDTSKSGEETLLGDSIALCIFPKTGIDGPEDDQLRWYLSKASPGGGSGSVTVFRPSKYSCGAKYGQLVKDSSVYTADFKREGTLTTYKLHIPWSEIPGFTPAVGATFGCNIVLTDSDGAGNARGQMTWGVGLRDNAGSCGIVTLIR